MGTLDRGARSIHGKIVYFGPQGAGKTANLELLARKLKQEHRGDLKVIQGEGSQWEHLPVSLGEVRGWETSLDIWAVPGREAADAVRARLLEDADGVAFVADLRRERHDATMAALEELLALLSSQSRSLDEIALVIQYNHRDGADENAVEQLHRRLGLEGTVSFDAVAVEGKGVLQTLSALAKQVLAVIRARADAPPKTVPAAAAPEPQPAATEPLASYEDTALDPSIDLEVAPLEPDAALEPDAPLERRWQLRLGDPGAAEGPSLRLPLRLRDAGSGEEIAFELEIRVSPSAGR